jgi:hypothetical protein
MNENVKETVKKTLLKQLELLSEASQKGYANCGESLAGLTHAMISVVNFLALSFEQE